MLYRRSSRHSAFVAGANVREYDALVVCCNLVQLPHIRSPLLLQGVRLQACHLTSLNSPGDTPTRILPAPAVAYSIFKPKMRDANAFSKTFH